MPLAPSNDNHCITICIMPVALISNMLRNSSTPKHFDTHHRKAEKRKENQKRKVLENKNYLLKLLRVDEVVTVKRERGPTI